MRNQKKNIKRSNNTPARRRCKQELPPDPLTLSEGLGWLAIIFLIVIVMPYAMWTNLNFFFESKPGKFVIFLLVLTSIVAYREVVRNENVKYYGYFKILTSLAEFYWIPFFLIAVTTVIDGIFSNKGWLALLIAAPGSALITIGLGLPVSVVLALAIKVQVKGRG